VMFFLSPGSLRGPSTDRRETLPHGRKLVQLDKFSQNIRGHSPPPKKKKIGGQKHAKFRAIFLPLLTLIANISGMGQDIENRKDIVISSDSFRVRRKRSGGLWSTSYREFHVSLNPLKCTFWPTIFRPLGGASPSNFYIRY